MELFHAFLVIIATVCVFLFAIHKFSRQVEHLAGPRFKDVVHKATDTPLKGTIVGTLFTAIIQSSTATTVMLVGLIDAGAISFFNSLGIIFGANIGTTITSQLVAFNVIAIAPVFVILGLVLEKVQSPYKKYGKIVFYFGLVFLCLMFISATIEPLKNNPQIVGLFSAISNIYVAVVVGVLITVLFQASALISGIAVVLVSQGVLNFDQAFGIILGANIGTTSTALIAASVMNLSAKKAAVAHFFFNFFGVLLCLVFIEPFRFIADALTPGDAPALLVANAHMIFNIASALCALLLVRQFYKLVNATVAHFQKPTAV